MVLNASCKEEKRQYVRMPFFAAVEHTGSDWVHRNFIRNISAGGMYIEARKPLFPIEEITLTFSFPHTYCHVKGIGEVIWTERQGFGVRFKNINLFMEKSAINDQGVETGFIADLERRKNRQKEIRKIRIRWNASDSRDVMGYKLYWKLGKKVGYRSEAVELGNVTEIILPDDVSSIPQVSGIFELGITAVNYAGNESDIRRLKAVFSRKGRFVR